MKHFYAFLKGLMAVMLLCVPTLASAADETYGDVIPDDILGAYSITLGEATFADEDYDASEVTLTYKGWLTKNANGQPCLTGLIGTPSQSDWDPETYMMVSEDSCYVGTYDAEAQTITFVWPEGEFDIVDSYYNIWNLSEPFTVSVSKNDEGFYVLSTSDALTYTFNGDWGTTCNFAGVSMVQQQSYTMAKEDLVGKWELTYNTMDDMGNIVPADTTMTFAIAEDEDGNLYATHIFGGTDQYPISYDALTGIKIPYTIDYDNYSYIYGDQYAMGQVPVWFSFGEDNTLVLESWMNGSNEAYGEFYVANGTAVKKGVEVLPVPGHYATMPTDFVVCTNGADIDASSVEVYYRIDGGRGVQIETSECEIVADSIKFSIPASAVYNKESLRLTLDMKDVNGNAIVYGKWGDFVVANYTADVLSNTFVIVETDPADGSEVTSLSTIQLTFEGDGDYDFVGGFDTSKTVELLDADGTVVATGTLGYPTDNPDYYYDLNAVVTLDKEITEAGTYTLHIPEATVYNASYDPEEDDFGVSYGAIYNPEFTATFKVVPSTGINQVGTSALSGKSIYTINGTKLRTTDATKLPRGLYIINGQKVLVK